MRRSYGSVTALLAVVLGLLLPSAAQAHRAASYFDVYWRTDAGPSPALTGGAIDWAFTTSFEEAWHDDAILATAAWNEHAETLRFANLPGIEADRAHGACNHGDVSIARGGTIDGDDGGILAYASVCMLPPFPLPGVDPVPYQFFVTYDDAEPWHSGPPPVPGNRFDLQGVLAHEFGHTVGWFRHFDETAGTECIEALRHTMCSTLAPGTADPRDLEPHDIDTWQDAY